jgi:hypothetical protein
MRYGLLALAIAVSIGIYNDWFVRAVDHATSAALTEEARLAIDVRCQLEDDRAAQDCRNVLKKLFLAGSLGPERTLRTYCDSVRNAWWGGRGPALPEVCVQRYGGWPQGLNGPTRTSGADHGR